VLPEIRSTGHTASENGHAPQGHRRLSSAWGAEASAILTSILATARKRDQNLFEAFLAIAGPSPLLAVPARA
jgi:hypothetical protein